MKQENAMKQRMLLVISMAVLALLAGQVMGDVVGGAELYLDVNDQDSWYGGDDYNTDHYADLPDSDAWWNLNTSGAYGHNLGDITNADGTDVPTAQPGAYLGYNGSSLDQNIRRGYNPNFVAGTGGATNYFSGWVSVGDVADGYRFNMERTPDRRTDVTWEVWYRLSSAPANANRTPYIMANERYTAGEGFGIFEHVSNTDSSKRRFYWRAMQGASSASSIASGEYDYDDDADAWFHIVGTLGSDGVQNLYVNGELVATVSGIGQSNDTAGNPLGLLYRPSANSSDWRPSDGDLAVVRIYHDVLSSDDVIQNFNTDAEIFGHEVIPEPATMCLLTAGGVGILLRRKTRQLRRK
jgi:hypothetical protein